MNASFPAYTFLSLTPKDRMYNCLPLYHSAGGMMVMAACIRAGTTVVLRLVLVVLLLVLRS
jgi:acyl-CoA synthetase (AMP-forming)/AMP-acid ligase II